MQLDFNQLMSMLIGVVLIVGLIGLLVYLKTRPENKGRELGKVILEQFRKYPLSIFLYVDMLFMIAEGGFAASIGDHLINPLFRFSGHMGLAFLSLVAALYFPIEARRFFQCFDIIPWAEKGKGKNLKHLPVRLPLITLILVLTVLLPWVNAAIIANGIHQFTEFKLAMSSLTPWISQDDMLVRLIMAGKSPLYSPWAEMSYPMIACLGITWTHMVLIAWKSFKLMDSSDPVTQKAYADYDAPPDKDKNKDKDKSKDKNKDKDKDKDAADDESDTTKKKPRGTEEVLRILFEFVGFKDKELDNKVRRFVSSIDQLDDAEQISVAQRMAPLSFTASSIIKDLEAAADNSSRRRELEEKKKAHVKTIQDTFAKARNKGGIGMNMGVVKN